MPAPKTPVEPDHKRFEKKPKVWMGVNRNADPAAIKDNQLVNLVNVRSTFDGFKDRAGMTKATTFPTSGQVDGIHEAGDIGAPDSAAYSYTATEACTIVNGAASLGTVGAGLRTSTGLMWFPINNSGDLQIVELSSSGFGRQHCLDNGTCGGIAGFHTDHVGLSGIVGTPATTILHTFPLPNSSGWCSNLIEVNGVFYLYYTSGSAGEQNNGDAARVYIYDPGAGSLTEDEQFTFASGFKHPGRVYSYPSTNRIFVAQYRTVTGANHIFVRKADTTYAEIAKPASYTDMAVWGVAELGSFVYFAGHPRVWSAAANDNSNVFRWDKDEGTLLMTSVVDLRQEIEGGAGTSFYFITSTLVSGTDIYYTWIRTTNVSGSVPTPSNFVSFFLGKFDGATWDHTWLDLTSTISAFAAVPEAWPMTIIESGGELDIWTTIKADVILGHGLAVIRVDPDPGSPSVIGTASFLGPSDFFKHYSGLDLLPGDASLVNSRNAVVSA